MTSTIDSSQRQDAKLPSSADAISTSATATAFFLDVDGTLLGFRSQPGEVIADPALLDLLEDLRIAASGAVALVSGRMIADLDRIVAPLVLPAAGVHGADIRFADGRRASTGMTAMDPVRSRVETFVAGRPGLLLEDKGATLALHYRHAPERAEEIRVFLQGLRGVPGVVIQEGKLVAELKPAGCDKGTAILALLATPPFLSRQPLFVGDDLTDEHGFAAVNKMGGISVKVGPPDATTQAGFTIANPEATRALLRRLC